MISNIRKNRVGTTSFDLKLANMRKAQDFTVYPIKAADTSGLIIVQSPTRFGKIDIKTGKGRMSQAHSNGAYSIHWSTDTLVEFQLSETELAALRESIYETASPNAGMKGILSFDNAGAFEI